MSLGCLAGAPAIRSKTTDASKFSLTMLTAQHGKVSMKSKCHISFIAAFQPFPGESERASAHFADQAVNCE
jgi:hypothetical protein